MPVPLIEPGFAARGERLGHGAETAVAGAELADGGGERRGIEIGPHAGREDQLGIGAFPEEEIAETALTSSADEEVDGRTKGVVERFAGKCGDAARGGEEGGAAGIIDGNAQPEARAGGCSAFDLADGVAKRIAQAVAAADDFEANVV